MMALPMVAAMANVVAAEPLKLLETDEAIVVKQNGVVVVHYNKISPPAPDGIDSVYRRSGCLHPVASPQGRVATQMFPFDHPHQHGIFSAWVKTKYDGKPIDFWNLAGGTGRVAHERVVNSFQRPDAAGFVVDMLHRATADRPANVLRERWKITAYPTDGGHHRFDLETVQTALTDKPLTVSQYHYGGLALRGPTRWLTSADREARKRPELPLESSGFVNNLGSSRVAGNHQRAKWVALWGLIDGQPVTIAVLCHADNYRSPQAARLHPTKPYFCFAPCVHGDFVIDRDHPLKGRYRFLVTDAKPDAKWLDQQWEMWCGR